MTQRRAIYAKDSGNVVNIWLEYDPMNPRHAGWTPPQNLALGPPDPAVQVGDRWNGSTYEPAPPKPTEPIDTSPGPLDVMTTLIELGVKKGDGSAITKEDLPTDWRTLMR